MLNILKNISNNSPSPHAFAGLLLESRLSITKIFTNKSLNTQYKEEKNPKTKNKLIILSNNGYKNLSYYPSNNEYKNLIYYPSSTKEWFSSVYSYNKSYVKSLITKNIILNSLFRSYFNMFENKIKILFKRRRANKNRYSANKIYVSRAEIKHRNINMDILLYTYDKQKSFIERTIWSFIKWPTNVKYLAENTTTNNIEVPKLDYIFRKYFQIFKWQNVFFKINNKILNNTVFFIKKKYFKSESMYLNNRSFKRLYKFKQLFTNTIDSIHFNSSKFNNLFLNLSDLGLNSLIEKIYDNKAKIKTVQLKSIHLNSDVFSWAVALKLKDRKNKAVRVLRKAILNMVKIPDLHTLITFDDSIENINKNNIINVIRQQVVSGIRFEAKGRLTRRLTAMRAIFKYRYSGSLKDIRSSFNSKSTTMLRGYAKPGLEYTVIDSKTRNGSFGLKTWLSSH